MTIFVELVRQKNRTHIETLLVFKSDDFISLYVGSLMVQITCEATFVAIELFFITFDNKSSNQLLYNVLYIARIE